MPTKNRTSVLMTLPPECARATAMPINPCTGAPGATPHWTCIAANPPGHASPPGTHGTGGKRSLPAGRPVRPVYQQDQFRTREGYRGGCQGQPLGLRAYAHGPPVTAISRWTLARRVRSLTRAHPKAATNLRKRDSVELGSAKAL